MSAKTKIMVIKRRELIYTGLFAAFIVILAILLFLMFRPGRRTDKTKKEVSPSIQNMTEAENNAKYIAGIYTTPISLGESSVDVEVTVDESHINAIRLVNLSEATTAMFPLVSPSMEDLALQICEKQSLENITCPENNRYTSQMLLNAISAALENAKSENWQ